MPAGAFRCLLLALDHGTEHRDRDAGSTRRGLQNSKNSAISQRVKEPRAADRKTLAKQKSLGPKNCFEFQESVISKQVLGNLVQRSGFFDSDPSSRPKRGAGANTGLNSVSGR